VLERVPTIIVSACFPRQAITQQGMSGLEKPFDLDTFLETIAHLFSSLLFLRKYFLLTEMQNPFPSHVVFLSKERTPHLLSKEGSEEDGSWVARHRRALWLVDPGTA
jgi:hypothetical protein